MSSNSGIDTVKNVYTFGYATEMWELGKSTLRQAVADGRFNRHDLKYGSDYMKQGNTWLITDMAMRRLYGPPVKKITNVDPYKDKKKAK